MGSVIKTDSEAAEELARVTKENLSGYLGFTLNDIGSLAPVSGNRIHDRLQYSITASLEAWEDLITSDANLIINAAMKLESFDSNIAQKLLGTGAVT